MSSIYKVSNEGITSQSETLAPAAFADAGQKGWTIQTYSAVGVDYVMLAATKDSVAFPLHKDTVEWFGYVVEGEGELHLGNETEVKEVVSYKAGDIICFEAHTFHGWKNLSDSTKLLFSKPSA